MRTLNSRASPSSASASRSSSARAPATASRRRNAAAFPSPAPPLRRASSSSTTTTIASAASGGGPSLLQKLGRVFSEKATADIERVFKGASKTREKLGIVDELFAYWTLENSEDALEELEEALIASDFGPRAALRVVDGVRDDVRNGKAKTPADLKSSLKRAVVSALQPGAKKGSSGGGGAGGGGGEQGTTTTTTSQSSIFGLNLDAAETDPPAIVMVVGVNGGGKTTTIGKLAARLKNVGGASVALAAGDTFRAAAAEQLAGWAERAGVAMADSGDAQRPDAVLYKAAQWAQSTRKKEIEGVERPIDVLLCDTSGRLHTNDGLMAELAKCGKSLGKAHRGAPHETLLVLDGTTGLNMLAQAREFNAAVELSGLVVTKLDGSAKGGAVVGVVSELGVPVKFIGVGEQVDDLQPFDAVAFVDALFPENDSNNNGA